MKNKTIFIILFSAVMLIILCFLVCFVSYSTDEDVRRRSVMAYYHTIGRSAEKREAARYLFDNMPYHYGYGVTVHDSKEVKRWAEKTTATFAPHCKIVVWEDGVLNIDGATLNNARIVIKSGGKLNITNGGIINSRDNRPFVISKGARIKISNGKIK